jgi:hypothetical protein
MLGIMESFIQITLYMSELVENRCSLLNICAQKRDKLIKLIWINVTDSKQCIVNVQCNECIL